MIFTSQQARPFLLLSVIFLIGTLFIISVPSIQSQLLFLNAVSLPLFVNFNTPEYYGLSPNKTLNLKIQTPDQETLGAWLTLSETFHQSRSNISTPTLQDVSQALGQSPTVLFLHGNGATRAFDVRVRLYSALSSRLGVNVLAIDYRGYGDSTGSPSEAGLVIDARAAWDWLSSHGASERDILIMGHSLGTGVTAQLAAQLSIDQRPCRGVALMSPFSSIRNLLGTETLYRALPYPLFRVTPLMQAISMIPYVTYFLTVGLVDKFDTSKAIQTIVYPLILGHSEDDSEIPSSHSEALFSILLGRHLNPPPGPLMTFTEPAMTPGEVPRQSTIGTIGKLSEFTERGPTGQTRKVVLLNWKIGGHDQILVQEGVQDVLGRTFGLLNAPAL